ncbi:MAG: ferredoxin [Candidatus Aminicenantes bacterium]|nr:ferredoxin [Candidatus Aminicenantes bacterium]
MLLVDANRCCGCGICTTICPQGLELKVENGYARIINERADCMNEAMRACPQNAIAEIKEKLVFAIGTDDDKTIKANDHVGMANFFQILEYSDGELLFKEKRTNPKYNEDETRTHGDPGKAKATASALRGVDVLVGKRFGPNIIRLKNQFVCVIVREKEIPGIMDIIKNNIGSILVEKNKKDGKERSGIVLK